MQQTTLMFNPLILSENVLLYQKFSENYITNDIDKYSVCSIKKLNNG